MTDAATSRSLCIDGKPILSLGEFQSYAYGLPEDAVPPGTLTRWMAGDAPTVDELLACLNHEAAAAASGSDEALEIVRLAVERIAALFPHGSV
jgi:hypothetical protein